MTLKVALVEPVRAVPPVRASHATGLVDDHVQSGAVATTATEDDPAVGPTVPLVAGNAYPHATPAWLTVNVRPPTLTVPVRGWLLGLATAVTVTLPGPVPDAPVVTWSHGASLTAVHAQSATAVLTAKPPSPPDSAMDWAVGARAIPQGRPAWCTV